MADTHAIHFSTDFPSAPAKVFLVGIGGIGMSGLAQFLKHQGYEVAGSDRGLLDSSRQGLFNALRAAGITLYPQDGSGPVEFRPDAFVFTTAIEPGNPDQLAAPGTPVFHRAFVLSHLCTKCGGRLIGVAGTCGKTSVTGWIGSALNALGRRIVLVDGGYLPEFESSARPGNFFASSQDAPPEFVVVEIDESDHSINGFSPDYGVVLNVGDDHYGTEELIRVFRSFLSRCRSGAAYPSDVPELAVEEPSGRVAPYDCSARGYAPMRDGMRFVSSDGIQILSTQSGLHNAWNGEATYRILRLALPCESPERIAEAMSRFRGVLQRFELLSDPSSPVAVVNDYAHNPEKIAASIQCARERFGSPLGIVFQPHGFGALRFMEEALAEHLRGSLEPGDLFMMLPVYYAGGTVTFSPTSEEVAGRFAESGVEAVAVPSRREAAQRLANGDYKAWLVLGARDASLREWTIQLAAASQAPAAGQGASAQEISGLS